ncbi:MAG TPA: winged helix-turn-helix domain-containing protein [Candidatus Nanoarchaeia archaeon]|nr:winged helix-turn-helix domain-containing protein [Candidatus Nanoarchaeia archaeon]
MPGTSQITSKVAMVRAISKKRNRDRLEIVSEILAFCKKPQSRTSIMVDLAMNPKMLAKFLLEMQQAKLLEGCQPVTEKCFTTPRGIEYLKKYNELRKIADFSSKSPLFVE